MTAPNPEIDPALRALGHAQRAIVDAISAYVLANVNGEWEKTLLTNDRLLNLIGALVLERDENAKDALRYRWLISHDAPGDEAFYIAVGDSERDRLGLWAIGKDVAKEETDTEIDAAMKAGR